MKPLSKDFLLKRGSCCNNGCKNCPYKNKNMKELKVVMRPEHGKIGLIELCNDIKSYLGEDNLTILEVGSYMGESAVIFAEQFPNSQIICVDPWEGNYDPNDFASQSDFIEVEEQFDLRAKNFSNIKKIKDYSTNVNINFDFIYLDGNHSYEGVRNDILHFLKFKNKKCIIAGHDYYTDEQFLAIHTHIAGVKKAVDIMIGTPDKLYSDSSWMIKICE